MSKKKKGLGKGLSALFGDQKNVEKSTDFKGNLQKALIGELARLTTTLAMLEDRQEYEKCAIIKNRIKNIENKLKNL